MEPDQTSASLRGEPEVKEPGIKGTRWALPGRRTSDGTTGGEAATSPTSRAAISCSRSPVPTARGFFTAAQIAKKLAPDDDKQQDVLADVKRFEKASLAGEYYDSFNVNSKNYTDVSMGTRAWYSDFRRLFQQCVDGTKTVEPVQLRGAFDTLLGLLDYIDECHDDVIFFADEGGSWQVGMDWQKVLPAYFACLSTTAAPEEYAARVVAVVDKHQRYNRKKHLAAARRCATPAQRKALRGA